MDAVTNVPFPVNEPVRTYAPGSQERAALENRIKELAGERAELTMTVGGQQKMGSGERVDVLQPHNHQHVLGQLGTVTDDDVAEAIAAAKSAAPGWRALSYDDRAAVFLRAADLLAGPWRATVNAATMLGQSKSVHQAEIDAACELIDFWRYNVHYGRRLLAEQPGSAAGSWNRLEYRPLEGFVLAITPFNFTSIAGNLPTAPALLGNVVVWKPSSTQQLSAHYLMRVLEAAGLPPGVINMVTGSGRPVSRVALADPDLAGIHFTGSTGTFQHLWRTVGENIASYRGYPRLVGETGGKDFVIAHPSADPDVLVTALIRGAYEYQGQKCSAASRAYIPRSVWNRMGDQLLSTVGSLTMGDVSGDLSLFMGAVIDQAAFATHSDALARPGPGRRSGCSRAARPTAPSGTSSSPPCSRAPTPPTRYSPPSTSGRSSACTSSRTPTTRGSWPRPRTSRRTRSPARSSRRTGRRSRRPPRRCGSRPGTSTSTTSPPGRLSASSRSAGPGPAGPTTRRARSST